MLEHVPEVKAPSVGYVTTSKRWTRSCFRIYSAGTVFSCSLFSRYFAVCGCVVIDLYAGSHIPPHECTTRRAVYAVPALHTGKLPIKHHRIV